MFACRFDGRLSPAGEAPEPARDLIGALCHNDNLVIGRAWTSAAPATYIRQAQALEA